jgi:hypothetical protein
MSALVDSSFGGSWTHFDGDAASLLFLVFAVLLLLVPNDCHELVMSGWALGSGGEGVELRSLMCVHDSLVPLLS